MLGWLTTLHFNDLAAIMQMRRKPEIMHLCLPLNLGQLRGSWALLCGQQAGGIAPLRLQPGKWRAFGAQTTVTKNSRQHSGKTWFYSRGEQKPWIFLKAQHLIQLQICTQILSTWEKNKAPTQQGIPPTQRTSQSHQLRCWTKLLCGTAGSTGALHIF